MSKKKSSPTFLGSFPLYQDNEGKPIYTVTSLSKDRDCRCWGFFHNIEMAKKSVAMNSGDMHEIVYTHVVIEECTPGIVTIAKEIAWYRFRSDRIYRKGKWIESKKPSWTKNVINYSMG